ncbi:hypothetical protein FHS56_000922 [Thermonema lapsum]|uniref:Carboxypeptidase-like regulatory domain-containing protein n=1 Tax=Thermonema lapsum TaxID=28195 RepID=A0A846MPE7_9BACT|nr:DUF5686 family protein [Thermonema lapsum]NIK73436.1 hypothetical protein [Thermonema lapsum]
MSRCLLFLIVMLMGGGLFAQQKGRLIDAQTKEPLPFANIWLSHYQRVFTTDDRGYFSLPDSLTQGTVTFYYVGYESYTDSLPLRRRVIALQPTSYAIGEVVVSAAEDPAVAVIREMVRRRKQHHPKFYDSYRFKSYNQQLATVDLPADLYEKSLLDTETRALMDFLDKRYFFFAENISITEYKRPDYIHTKVIANKMMGFREPVFALVGEQIMPFSLYENPLKILGRTYLNPLSAGSWKFFDFTLRDTLTENRDTVLVITFEPWGQKVAEAQLRGILYVHLPDYALRGVMLRNALPSVNIDFQIHQLYEKVNGYWFPHQLSVDYVFNELKLTLNDSSRAAAYPLRFVNRTRIEEVEVGLPLKKKAAVAFEIHPQAHRFEDWEQIRPDSLSEKAMATYAWGDSISRATNFEKSINTLLAAAWYQSIPLLRYFEVPFQSLVSYDQYQGLRLGAALYTGHRLWAPLRVGGYVAYGFRDAAWKYGADGSLLLWKEKNLSVLGGFRHDVEEPGQLSFQHDLHYQKMTGGLRRLYAERMSVVDSWRAGVAMHPLPAWQLHIGWEQGIYRPQFDYTFVPQPDKQRFLFAESRIQLSYTFGERYAWIMGRPRLIEAAYPQLLLAYAKGWQIGSEGYDYQALQGLMRWNLPLFKLAEVRLKTEAAHVWGEVPALKLMHGAAAYDPDLWFEAPEHFQTMGLYEFLSDAYAMGSVELWSPTLKLAIFRPRLALIQRAAWGTLAKPELHANIPFQTMEKGYWESGCVLDGLYQSSAFGVSTRIGVGVFYRYGAYSLPHAADNWVVKVSFRRSL